MKCKYVICLICLTKEDDQNEIKANALSLKTKYDGRNANGQNQSVISIEISDAMSQPEIWNAVEQGCKGIPAKEKDVGIYFLCHGVANKMWPKPTGLAALTVMMIQKLQFGFRKLCLAACRSSGQKLNSGSFQESPMHQFCKEVELKLSDAKLADVKNLLDGAFVAGWEVFITTYEARLPYWDQNTGGWRDEAKGLTTLTVGPNLTAQPTSRSAVMEYKNNETTLSLTSTHPKLETHANNETMQKIEQIVAQQWQKNRATYKCQKFDTYQEALASDQLKGPHIGMFFKQVNKNLNENQVLLTSLASYMRTKIVARYSQETNKWAIASLADYSDNQIMSRMLRLAWYCDKNLMKSGLNIQFKPE